jgi:hypothetical protein
MKHLETLGMVPENRRVIKYIMCVRAFLRKHFFVFKSFRMLVPRNESCLEKIQSNVFFVQFVAVVR